MNSVLTFFVLPLDVLWSDNATVLVDCEAARVKDFSIANVAIQLFFMLI